jgi:hypothetical protein
MIQFSQTNEEINSADLVNLSNEVIKNIKGETNFQIEKIQYLGDCNSRFHLTIAPNNADLRDLNFASGPILDGVGTALSYVSGYS